MKRKTPHLIVLFLILLLAAACNSGNIEIGPTPDIPGFGSTPSSGGLMPEYLDCSVIPEKKLGYEWNDLTIGASTYEDVIERLNPKNVYWDEYYGHVVLSRDRTPFNEIATVCFQGNILSALQIYIAGVGYFPHDLARFVAEYGKPDRVSWGSKQTNAYRVMIWAEEGMYVIVEHIWEGDCCFSEDDVVAVAFFPPIPLEELEESWLMKAISPPPPPTGEEDWWGYNKD